MEWMGIMRFLPVLLLLCLLPSCVSRYERDFRKAAEGQAASPTKVTGPWIGEWRSEANGHHGPLWCMVSEAGSGQYDFRYRAGWGQLQFGDYTHRVNATPAGDGSLPFSGSLDLPGGVGVHEVKGVLKPNSFDARFQSERGDRGTMILRRPE